MHALCTALIDRPCHVPPLVGFLCRLLVIGFSYCKNDWTPVARLDNDTTGISDNQWQKGVQDSWLLQLSNATFLYHFLLNALNLDLTAVKSNYIRRETAEVIYYHLFWMI